MSVLERFEQQVRLLPDSDAVRSRGKCLTYRQLDERANQIAHALRSAGVQVETVVGLFLDRTADLIGGLLGIWKSGGAYLPLDPDVPRQRLSFMLDDCEARYLLTERAMLPFLPEIKGQVICIEDAFADTSVEAKSSLQEILPPDRLAYVIYTSGSTGKPKGVAICHEGIENNAIQAAEHLELTPEDVVLATITVAFDMSYLELFPTLIRGACLYIAERGCARDGVRLMEVMESSSATVAMGTPSVWNLLLETGWKGDPNLKIFTASEALPLTLGRTLARITKLVWNHYGPTEASISVSAAKIEPDTDIITIGKPMDNIQMHILSPSLQPVPKGEIGEIYLGGICVGRGYIKRDDLNKLCFLPDPFSLKPGVRIYKTGDLGRELPDGRIEYLGRKDDQVKIRGYRIELQEIEEAIREYGNIQAVSVQAIEISAGDQRLVAFIQRESPVKAESLKDFLAQKLPAYMIPSEYISVKDWPINGNGKVDRAALKAIRATQVTISRTIIKPRDAMEAALKECWERVLQVSPISITDDFFDLGGHSYLAARLFAEIQRKLGKRVPLSLLIENPTIEALASCIRQQKSTQECSGLVTMRSQGKRPPLFIAHGLGGNLLVFHDLIEKLEADRPVYGLHTFPGMLEDKTQLSIAKLASIYINQMKAVRPTGPYHIAGHSLGTLVAFEIARQLSESGDEVGMLVLLDWDLYTPFSPEPLVGEAEYVSTTSFSDSAKYHVRHAASMVARFFSAKRHELIYRRLTWEKLKWQFLTLKRFPFLGRLLPWLFGEDIYVAVSSRSYDPKFYAGDAVVFMAAEESRPYRNFGSGWSRIVRGDCEVMEVPGNHQTMFRSPNVEKLAKEVTYHLQLFDRAYSTKGPSVLTGS